jgi:O-antigen ligase
MQVKATREIMLDHFPTTKDFKSSQGLRRNVVLGLVILSVCLVVGTMTAIAYFVPQADPAKILIGSFAIIACVVLPVLICYYPRIGFYLLFVGALLFPGTHELATPTMLTSYAPFWWNLSTIGWYNLGTTALTGLAISPAEIIMVITFTVWFVRLIALRQFQFKLGVFFWAIAAYILMVVFGFINGLNHGANTTMALYEVRGQAYFFMTYLMAVNIITERRQLMSLLWIVVICNGLQGIFGSITYAVQHDMLAEDGFMAHDESLILNLIFFIAIMAGILGVDRRLKWLAIVLSPLALVAVLGNQRRASIAAFIVAFLPLIPILWMILENKRKQIGTLAVIFIAMSAVYLPIAWNSNAAWALPARAIRSQTDPSARDAASNIYRASEEYDCVVTRDASPIIGYGYGRLFLQPVPLPQVSTDFVYYMPHNSLLWVWMRIGHIGFFLFWFMVAVFLIRGLEILKTARLPESRLIGILALMLLIMMLTFGKYDLALVDLRVLTLTAVLLGALSVIPALEKRSGKDIDVGMEHDQIDTDDDPDSTYDASSIVRHGGAIPF